MKTFDSIQSFSLFRKKLSGTIGFVPTMGALHEGHLSLIKKSQSQTDFTIVSIYVNETQFSPDEDFDQYPRNLKNDLDKLKEIQVDVAFIPEKLYSKKHSTFIDEISLSNKLEGISRPSFFKGVATIVVKLFNIIQPTHTYFGKKDAQQLLIIKRLINNLNYNIQIVECDTIREQSGLALSSRNQYLSNQDKKNAIQIYAALKYGVQYIKQYVSISSLKEDIIKKIEQIPNAQIDYVAITNPESLEDLNGSTNQSMLISVAVIISKVRLIDNIFYQAN